LVYSLKNKGFISVTDKLNKRVLLNYLEMEGAVINDIDGGPMFMPAGCFDENNRQYLLAFLEPLKLKEYVASDKFIQSTPKYAEKKVYLKKLADTMKETDNPILMMVSLKN